MARDSARTILAGGNLVSDAGRQAIAAASDKRRRKTEARHAAAEALTGLGDTIKEHGDMRKAKAAEEELVGFQNDYALGLSTGGLDGALTAITARNPTSKEAAAWRAEQTEKLKADLLTKTEAELDRAQEWKEHQDELEMDKAELEFDKAADQNKTDLKREEIRREAREARAKRRGDRAEAARKQREVRKAERVLSKFRKKLELGTATYSDAYEASFVDGKQNSTIYNANIVAIQNTNPEYAKTAKPPKPSRQQEDELKLANRELAKAEAALAKIEGMDQGDRDDIDIEGGDGAYDALLLEAQAEQYYRRLRENLMREGMGYRGLYPDVTISSVPEEYKEYIFNRASQ